MLIDLLRGHERAEDLMLSGTAHGDYLCASVITRVELLQGKRPTEEAALAKLFNALEWIDVDTNIADRAGELASGHRSAHSGIKMGDYLIAATAIELDLRLLTRNTKHYPMIKGLKPAYRT